MDKLIALWRDAGNILAFMKEEDKANDYDYWRGRYDGLSLLLRHEVGDFAFHDMEDAFIGDPRKKATEAK